LTTASAPGKIILFGEHAVVYGMAAIGGAIDLRAIVHVQDDPGSVLVRAEDLTLRGFSFDLTTGRIQSAQAAHATRYISAVLREFDAKDMQISIKSGLPLAAGLGSSASIVVAAVAAVSQHQGHSLSRKEIAEISYRLEKKVQQGMGSPMDTALATYGGYLQIAQDIRPLDLPSLNMVVGYTGTPHDTKSEVEKVQNLRKRYSDLVGPVFQAIGSISQRAIPLIKEENMAELGELMNINHGLLASLGVSSRELEELVYAARGAGGALGAKLTGAGGGGCMIALPGSSGIDALLVAIRQARGMAFKVVTGCEGLRFEVEKL
jgi:mevalonate kinase